MLYPLPEHKNKSARIRALLDLSRKHSEHSLLHPTREHSVTDHYEGNILDLVAYLHFALTSQRYCGLNHSADYGVQYQLSEPSTEELSSGSYSLEPISEPDNRGKLGPCSPKKLTSERLAEYWVSLLEVRL